MDGTAGAYTPFAAVRRLHLDLLLHLGALCRRSA